MDFKQNETFIKQSKDWLTKNDSAEPAETSFCIKNVLGKNENLIKLTIKYFHDTKNRAWCIFYTHEF